MGAEGAGAGAGAGGCSRRSRFTNDEFSPRNADGDFFTAPVLWAGDDTGLRLSPVHHVHYYKYEKKTYIFGIGLPE